MNANGVCASPVLSTNDLKMRSEQYLTEIVARFAWGSFRSSGFAVRSGGYGWQRGRQAAGHQGRAGITHISWHEFDTHSTCCLQLTSMPFGV